MTLQPLLLGDFRTHHLYTCCSGRHPDATKAALQWQRSTRSSEVSVEKVVAADVDHVTVNMLVSFTMSVRRFAPTKFLPMSCHDLIVNLSPLDTDDVMPDYRRKPLLHAPNIKGHVCLSHNTLRHGVMVKTGAVLSCCLIQAWITPV